METSNSQNHTSLSSVAFVYWGKTTLPEESLVPSYFFSCVYRLCLDTESTAPFTSPHFKGRKGGSRGE